MTRPCARILPALLCALVAGGLVPACAPTAPPGLPALAPAPVPPSLASRSLVDLTTMTGCYR